MKFPPVPPVSRPSFNLIFQCSLASSIVASLRLSQFNDWGLSDEVRFGLAAAGSAGSERVLVLLQTGTQSSTGIAVYSERLGLGLVYEVKYITSSCRILLGLL